jgi:hypothetical protein
MIMALTQRFIGEAFVRAATAQEYAPVGYWWSNVVHLRGFMQVCVCVWGGGAAAAVGGRLQLRADWVAVCICCGWRCVAGAAAGPRRGRLHVGASTETC